MPKASDNIKIYRNPNGPVVSTVNRRVLEQDGLTFKDIDGTGTLSPVNDWRNSPAERAAAYVKTLSVNEKIAQLFISDWRMAKYPITGPMADLYKDIEKKTDETGILDEGEFRGKTIFGEQYLPGTSPLLKDWFNRHVILRANATPADLADWMNQADAVCEECEHFIPVAAASNSRNENGELVFGMNDAGGVLATWPGTLGIAAAVKGSKIDLVDKFADTIRREWNACGLRKGYMYMADAVTDPRWQRTYGTFGEDPALISEIMAHIIPRIQGSDHGVTEDGVAVTTSHFPGGGARENGFDPHYAAGQWNVYATPGSLETYHLPPFAAAVKAGTSSIMPYYSKPAAAKSAVQHDLAGNTVEMKPYGFAYNKYFIDTMLRGQMGFDGYINSDTGIAHNMAWGVEMLDVPERIGFAVANAGVDIISGLFDNEAGMEAYNRGKNGYYETHPLPEGFAKEELTLTDEALDRAVARTLTELFALGMFENPYRDPDEAARIVATPSDWEAAADAHRRSVVLRKNDGTLPLSLKDSKRMAVIGPNADSHAALVGTYNGSPPRSITVVEGITRICEDTGWDVNYAEGCLLYDDPSVRKVFQNYRIPEAVALAESCDLAIVCVGLDSTLEGEQGDVGNAFASGDKPDLLLPKIQRDLVEQVIATGTPVILIDLAGSPIDLSAYEDQVPAILHAWYPGGEGGRAIADILFGKVSPGGKLPLTFYYNAGPLPDITDYHMSGRTYRYFEVRPWKPFGFGLTYGELQITEAKVTEVDYTKEIPSAQITIHCQNPTDRDLSDVIQVYVHVNGSSNEVPNHKLAAFERIRLDAGESKEFRITIPPMAFTTVDNSGNRVFDGTSATLYLGFSQPDLTEEDQKIYTGNRGQVFAVTL